MALDLFACNDYRAYLKSRLEGRRGARSEVAQAIGCQNAFVSQVLGELNHFNLEHGEKLNAYLGHSSEEGHCFLLLIQLARAGTPGLRKYFQDQLQQVREARQDLQKRMQADPQIRPEDQQTYYSTWYYAAIHVCLGVPEFRTREAIAKRLGLPLSKISEVLEFLVRHGLAEVRENEFHPTQRWVHLSADSPLLTKHHVNWRTKTLMAFEQPRTDANFHYSLVVSISRESALELRKMMVEAVFQARELTEKSEAKEIFALCIDLFKV